MVETGCFAMNLFLFSSRQMLSLNCTEIHGISSSVDMQWRIPVNKYIWGAFRLSEVHSFCFLSLQTAIFYLHIYHSNLAHKLSMFTDRTWLLYTLCIIAVFNFSVTTEEGCPVLSESDISLVVSDLYFWIISFWNVRSTIKNMVHSSIE